MNAEPPSTRRSPRKAAGSPLRPALLALVALLLLAPNAHGGGIRYFGDSNDSTFYPTSWGAMSGASWVELAETLHFPVDPTRPFLGSNSLRLNWISAPGGDWAMTAAAPGWSAHDTSPFDSLVFMAWTEDAISASELPMIFLEDQDNTRTPRLALSAYSNDLAPREWRRISVPMAAFRANPGSADLTRINKVFFGQNPAVSSGTPHTLILDEIRIVDADGTPPAPPRTTARAFERHIEIRWDSTLDPDTETLRIEKRSGATWKPAGDARAEDGTYVDWVGAPGVTGVYRAVALDWSLNASAAGDPDSATTAMLDTDGWLDMVEEAAFRYFWLHSHPVSGLAREVYGSGETCTSGGTGMGIMATIAAADRGFVTREQARTRILGILQFLSTYPTRYHGAFAHWMNGTTGATIPFNGPDDYSGDIVETAYLMQGILTARQYFDGSSADEIALRNLATQLWEAVEWDWFRPASPGNVLYWHWAPTWGFSQSIPVTGWNETMITYVLAMASPTHPIPAGIYHDGWARGGAMVNGTIYYEYLLPVGPAWGGPLFFAHYSFLGLDPRFHRDAYANYFLQNRNHSLINWTYCRTNPLGHAGYSDEIWGLTASYDPWGYRAHAPFSDDNGTIAPTAALSSMPYTYLQSMTALKAMYRDYGRRLWGPFGYRDAFNPGESWTSELYVAIDEGPIAVMIENARTQLLWNLFMSNPEIEPALTALGFTPDQSLGAPTRRPVGARARLDPPTPNPASGSITFAIEIPDAADVDLSVFDIAGRLVATVAHGPRSAGRHLVRWDPRSARLAGGIYFLRLETGDATASRRFVVVQ
jgi:hypothetical protein